MVEAEEGGTMNTTQKESSRIEALDAAAAVIDGRLGILEGCRLLTALGEDLVPEGRADKDFLLFAAVGSDIEALASGLAWQYRNPAAPHCDDAQIERAENMYRHDVVATCRSVVTRFAGPGDDS